MGEGVWMLGGLQDGGRGRGDAGWPTTPPCITLYPTLCYVQLATTWLWPYTLPSPPKTLHPALHPQTLIRPYPPSTPQSPCPALLASNPMPRPPPPKYATPFNLPQVSGSHVGVAMPPPLPLIVVARPPHTHTHTHARPPPLSPPACPQVGYGAVIVSFLGAVHWGAAMSSNLGEGA